MQPEVRSQRNSVVRCPVGQQELLAVDWKKTADGHATRCKSRITDGTPAATAFAHEEGRCVSCAQAVLRFVNARLYQRCIECAPRSLDRKSLSSLKMCGCKFLCGPMPSLTHAQGRSSYFLAFFQPELPPAWLDSSQNVLP